MMNRRAFLAWLGGTAAGVALAPTLDLDKLLWVPGEKTIFLPPVIAHHGNTFVTPEWLMREVAPMYANALKFAIQVNREFNVPFQSGRTYYVPLRVR